MENKDTIVDKLLCMACLCVGRSLHNITDDKMKQFYLGALNEIPVSINKIHKTILVVTSLGVILNYYRNVLV